MQPNEIKISFVKEGVKGNSKERKGKKFFADLKYQRLKIWNIKRKGILKKNLRVLSENLKKSEQSWRYLQSSVKGRFQKKLYVCLVFQKP